MNGSRHRHEVKMRWFTFERRQLHAHCEGPFSLDPIRAPLPVRLRLLDSVLSDIARQPVPDIVVIGSWGRHDWGLSRMTASQAFSFPKFQTDYDESIHDQVTWTDPDGRARNATLPRITFTRAAAGPVTESTP